MFTEKHIRERFDLAYSRLWNEKKFLSITEFSKSLGYPDGRTREILKGRTKIGLDFITKFCDVYNISIEYIIYGKQKHDDNQYVMIEKELNSVKDTEILYKTGSNTIEKSEVQEIPLYNIEATAGLVSLFANQTSQTIIDTIKVPNLPKCDGAVYVTGDSMYPILKSGDIVIYKVIHNIKDNIFFGEMYLISIVSDDDEYITLKYIQKSEKGEDYIQLVSQNRNHQPKDIQINRITALAFVKASIRLNSMS